MRDRNVGSMCTYKDNDWEGLEGSKGAQKHFALALKQSCA